MFGTTKQRIFGRLPQASNGAAWFVRWFAGKRSAEGTPAIPAVADGTEPRSETAEQVVATHWSRMAQAPPRIYSWTDSVLVERHINRTISGDPNVGWVEYACRKYLLKNGRGVARGLSLGCGGGSLERAVRAMGACETVDAYDIAPGAIDEARKAADREGISGISYQVANLETMMLGEALYDVVFAPASVHHIANLEGLFASVARCLKPGGYFILLEYVGPTQFQVSDEVVQIVNDILAILPPTLRERSSLPGDHFVRFQRNPIELMNQVDPSEAIRSAEILPVLAKTFTLVEKRDFGGTLNQLLLQDIIHNFEADSPERAAMLNLLLYFEMLLIRKRVIDSDLCFVVAQPCSFNHTTQ